MQKTPVHLLTATIFLVFLAWVPSWAAEEFFPVFPCIRNNVMFWQHIYETFTTRQAVVHDQDDLSRIYGIVSLLDPTSPEAVRTNRRIMKDAKRKYRNILQKLSTGRAPRTREELMVAALFPSATTRVYQRAMKRIRIQVGQKDRFVTGVIRSGAYIGEMKRIFSSYGLPEDLAYLPHVESSFHTRARSHSGAVGAWQFILSTGRQFLTINRDVDERYDPLLSSHAAARFLQQNFEKLGSWPLAITAYHHGPNGMLRAVRAKGSFERIITEYQGKGFKFASKNYYAEFLAALRVAKKLENDPAIRPKPPLTAFTVKFPYPMSVTEIYRQLSVSPERFARLNPALRKRVLSGRRPIPKNYPIRLPDSPAIRQALELAAASSSSTGQLPGDQLRGQLKGQLLFHVYEVKPGDTACSIARRFNVGLDSLLRLNGLDRKAVIFSGRRLRIPVITPITSQEKVVLLSKRGKKSPDG